MNKEENMKKIASLLIIILIGVAVGADAAAKPRKFYVTRNTFTGSQATTACATGYHMASLWEIFDVTNLRYETTLGITADDSGFGPPSVDDGFGWIRTGGQSRSNLIPGSANCFAWMSDSDSDLGTSIGLNLDWGNQFSDNAIVNPWQATFRQCNVATPVWCVQD